MLRILLVEMCYISQYMCLIANAVYIIGRDVLPLSVYKCVLQLMHKNDFR
jgi:hypothetical protein